MDKHKKTIRAPRSGGSENASHKPTKSNSSKTSHSATQDPIAKKEETQKTDEKPFANFPNMAGSVMEKGMEQARVAMKNYLRILETSLSTMPHIGSDQKAKWMRHAEQNAAAAFEFAEKLTHVKDIHGVAKIHTEFLEMQMKNLSEQTKDLGEAASKVATAAFTYKSP